MSLRHIHEAIAYWWWDHFSGHADPSIAMHILIILHLLNSSYRFEHWWDYNVHQRLSVHYNRSYTRRLLIYLGLMKRIYVCPRMSGPFEKVSVRDMIETGYLGVIQMPLITTNIQGDK